MMSEMEGVTDLTDLVSEREGCGDGGGVQSLERGREATAGEVGLDTLERED